MNIGSSWPSSTLQVGAYGDAYAHFSRGYELDRTAVGPLSMMTELAVINGRMDLAEDHLKELIVLAPNDRAVAVARGFAAHARRQISTKAQENVDLILLRRARRDSVANMPPARILVAQKKFPEAVDQLTGKLALSPNDRAMLRSLGAIHRYLGNWRKAAGSGRSAVAAEPSRRASLPARRWSMRCGQE